MEIPNGRYAARAKEWGLAETSKGSTQVAVLFQLLAEEMNGQTITWYGHFTDKTFAKTVEALRHCGFTSTDLAELESPTCGLDANEVSVVIEHEAKQNADGTAAEYEDGSPVMMPRVRWVNAAGGAGLSIKTPLTGDKAKAFGAEMKARLMALELGKPPAANGAPKTPPRAPVAKPATPAAASDDIPF